MKDLSQETALVTGAAKRLGRATALALADHGISVVVHYNNSADEAEQTAQDVRALGVDAWTLQADLANPHEAETLYQRATELAGTVSIAVNNASVFEESQLTDFSAADLHKNVNVHAMAPTHIARQLARSVSDGAIVNCLDCLIADYDRKHATYHLSKRMLFSLTRMMAVEFAPNVRVNAVAPGLILPPEGKDQAYLQSLAPTNPLNRCGNESDVTETILFLLRSPFITGQIVYIDGGRHTRGNMYG